MTPGIHQTIIEKLTPVETAKVDLDKIDNAIAKFKAAVDYSELVVGPVAEKYEIKCEVGRAYTQVEIYTKEIAVANTTFEAGSVIGLHSHKERELIEILSGKMEIIVGGVTHVVEAGGSVYIAPEVKHTATFPLATKARIMTIPASPDWPRAKGEE